MDARFARALEGRRGVGLRLVLAASLWPGTRGGCDDDILIVRSFRAPAPVVRLRVGRDGRAAGTGFS